MIHSRCDGQIFGDLVYPEHREWAERLATRAGLIAVEPLWGEPTLETVQAFLGLGRRALIVTVNAKWLDESWLGTEMSLEAVQKLIELGVDRVARTASTTHSSLTAQVFSHVIQVTPGEVVNVRGCWA